MADNPHFRQAGSWKEAAKLVDFRPTEPGWTDGHRPSSFSVFVMDHNKRELPLRERSLEVYFDAFSFSQARKGAREARRWALEVSYGPNPRPVEVGEHAGRLYDLGPLPEPDDIDPRMPAIVSWFDDDMFYLVASDTLDAGTLLRVAESCYPVTRGRRR